MRGLFCCFLLAALIALATLEVATAGPSCAGRFVGTWSYAGGTTTVAVNGLAYPHCAGCVTVQSWTCQGNTYLFSNSGPPGQFSATLIDSNHMQGSGGIATRIGGGAPAAPSVARNEPAGPPKQSGQPKPVATRQAAPPPVASADSLPKSANCSTITGLGGGDSGPSNCTPSNGVPPNVQAQINQAQSYAQAAKTVKESDPSYNGWSAAAAQFRKAEAAFRAAKDLVQAAAAAEQAQTLENALKIADRRAGQEVAANAPAIPPSDAASADQPSNACPAKAPASYWQNTPDAAYCANANCVDRGSALYGYLCFPPSGAVSTTKPNPDPQQLGLLAREACKASYSRESAQCFGDTKFKAILTARPDIEDYCKKNVAGYSKLRDALAASLASTAATGDTSVPIDRFIVCVDDVYLHGFPTPLRERLATVLSQGPVTVDPLGVDSPGEFKQPHESLPHDRCLPGQGMKPTPGGFGAWSCQPLGTIFLARNKESGNSAGDSGDGAASLAAFENRVTVLAAEAAAVAAERAGGNMSEAERQMCVDAAYAEARAVLKGGSAGVPGTCKAMVSAALSQLGIDIAAYPDDYNAAMAELLAGFDHGARLGNPLPGMVGLTPLNK